MAITPVADEAGPQSRSAIDPAAIKAGVIGLGLMGRSVATCLLAAGHPVIAVTRRLEREATVRSEVEALLRQMSAQGILRTSPETILPKLVISGDHSALGKCQVVVESIIEDLDAKHEVLRRVEAAVSPTCLIGSNTSAIPVTRLQEGARNPERILGIHWAEPAHVTRFLEVICGAASAPKFAEYALRLATVWGKEPTLVRRDIPGFIANRLMYAMIREAFYLVEAGYATPADIDRSVRNDMGWWLTLAGPFRFMDLTGIPAYAAVMRDLLPELSRSTEVPDLMRRVVASGATGVSNAQGFYEYTPEQARRWEETFLKFTYEIRTLAMKYPAELPAS